MIFVLFVSFSISIHVLFSYLQESLVACAAFTALSMFDPSDFKLIHLPEKVQLVYNFVLLKSPVRFLSTLYLRKVNWSTWHERGTKKNLNPRHPCYRHCTYWKKQLSNSFKHSKEGDLCFSVYVKIEFGVDSGHTQKRYIVSNSLLTTALRRAL